MYEIKKNWLENVFLKYLLDWKTSVMTCEGNFSQNARGCIFLSWQTTFEKLQVTVYTASECECFK